ncbi:hypothetical protein L1049_020703 [Liquidambar formosana]|uniref:Nodulin homeobox N-terminal domain-containing protein n=1 Tax=Liquidambar formosana TaxID=63359 RepID=A0AAP0SBR6_LIQFO
MRHAKEEPSCSTEQIDVEKLARFLPLHLIAVLMSSNKDEALFRYFLCGLRLLYSLCDLASRNTKLEQILLDDVKVSEQLLDLVFFLLIVLGGYQQENHVSSLTPLMHSALVACSLYLLTQCISPHWHELVPVLVAHPKVDIFMHVAFGAACVDIKFLQIKLSSQCTDICMKSSPSVVNYLCQQCEASLQFLQSLCQQKLFRERLLRNKVFDLELFFSMFGTSELLQGVSFIFVIKLKLKCGKVYCMAKLEAETSAIC